MARVEPVVVKVELDTADVEAFRVEVDDICAKLAQVAALTGDEARGIVQAAINTYGLTVPQAHHIADLLEASTC